MKTAAQCLETLPTETLTGVSTAGISDLVKDHIKGFSRPADYPCAVFSSPGRVELAGNHTDHNGGTVLAAAVDMDILAAVSPALDGEVTLRSDLFPETFRIDLSDTLPRQEESGTPAALIRGVAAGFRNRSVALAGLEVSLSSRVAPGSGLSSSAAFEMLLAGIFNDLYARGAFPCRLLALIGQEAENRFFGKPCGLMDQTVCACGGTLWIDFQSPEPVYEKIPFSFTDVGYDLFVVQTGSSHEGLADRYARVRMDMEDAARLFGAARLVELSRKDLLKRYHSLLEELGGRALLRAFHFFDEQDRVERLRRAMKVKQAPVILEELRSSGRSSAMFLQNCHSDNDPLDRGVLLGYYLSERFFSDNALDGSVRVHGGGFAGTVLSCVPASASEEYGQWMADFFGKSSVIPVRLREQGVLRLL